MGSTENMFFESIKNIIEMLKWPATVIIIFFILRKSIDRALQKISTFKYKTDKTSIEASIESIIQVAVEDGKVNNPPPPEIEQNQNNSQKSDNINAEHWMSNVLQLIHNNDYKTARNIFDTSILKVTDPNEAYSEKSFFLYLMYMANNDRELLSEFQNHIDKPTNEDMLVDAIEWYILCLERTKNYKTSTDYLLATLPNIKSSINITKITCSLSQRYIYRSEFNLAKEILVKRIEGPISDGEKYQIYKHLAAVEDKLKNINTSALCLDKALEFKPDDAELMFDSAYKASQGGLRAIEISNYDILTDISHDNYAAWNNFGVSAETEQIKSIAVNYFERAVELKNTLAMANKGNRLLDAGFLNQAEDIANLAIQEKEPHENVYKLLQKVKETRADDKKKWEEIKERAFNKQKEFRKYISYKFEKTKILELPDKFISKSGDVFNLEKLDGETISLKYNNESKTINIVGNLDNYSFNGIYTEAYPNEKLTLLSTSKNKTIKCFGYYDDQTELLYIAADDFNNEFKISLYKVHSG